MPELGLGLSIQRQQKASSGGGQIVASLTFHVQPDGAVAGVAFTQQPEVWILDGVGEVVTSYTGNVTVSRSPSTGTLGGTTTIAAVAGKALFTDLSLSDEGTFTLFATLPSTLSFESDSFTVAEASFFFAGDESHYAGSTTQFAGAA